MNFSPSDLIFDTLSDTRLKHVSMNIKIAFFLRGDLLVNNQHPVYVRISGGGYPFERFNTNVYVPKKYWDEKNRRIYLKSKELQDCQLILDNILSKLTQIKTTHRLMESVASPKIIRDEYEGRLTRVNFIAFFEEALKQQRSKLAAGSYDRHQSVLNKLREYKNYLPFSELSIAWFDNYRNYLVDNKGNLNTTINSNISSIKKFIKIAVKAGIKISFDLDDIEVGSTTGNRTYLTSSEVKLCTDYYFSQFITEKNKIVLGYFLFGCMTGLRKSNILSLDRREVLENEFSSVIVKSNKDRTISIIKKAKEVINYCADLFVKKYTGEEINRELKLIMNTLGITKHVTLHVARHTFATLFLKMGGKVELLQLLLCHANIRETMIYVHMLQEDANIEIHVLDKIFE